jgi:hypothetical protein
VVVGSIPTLGVVLLVARLLLAMRAFTLRKDGSTMGILCDKALQLRAGGQQMRLIAFLIAFFQFYTSDVRFPSSYFNKNGLFQ